MKPTIKLLLGVVTSCGVGLALSQANATAVVVGNGLAHSCYVIAQYGGDPREGVEVCTRALEQMPLSKKDRASTFVNRGVMRAKLGQPYDAMNDYERAIAVDPTLAQAYVDRSAALITLKRYDDAVKSADEGLSRGAAQPEMAYYNRAIAEEALGNVNGAYRDFKQAVALVPEFTAAAEQLKRFRIVDRPQNGS